MKKYSGYALITGGDRGIGFEIAKKLAENGYDLVLVARDAEKLKEAKESLNQTFKVDVVTLVKDLSEKYPAKDIFNKLKEQNIHVSLLVNNAGFSTFGPLEEVNHEDQQRMIDVMCSALTDMTYTFLPDMIAKGEGGIIFIASLAAHLNFPQAAVYGACKSFTESLGITLSYELDKKGIDVLTICPAVIRTGFFEVAGIKKEFEDQVHHPMGLAIHEPAEVAELLKYLGKKTLVVAGNMQDKFLFHSTHLLPFSVQKGIFRYLLTNVWKRPY